MSTPTQAQVDARRDLVRRAGTLVAHLTTAHTALELALRACGDHDDLQVMAGEVRAARRVVAGTLREARPAHELWLSVSNAMASELEGAAELVALEHDHGEHDAEPRRDCPSCTAWSVVLGHDEAVQFAEPEAWRVTPPAAGGAS